MRTVLRTVAIAAIALATAAPAAGAFDVAGLDTSVVTLGPDGASAPQLTAGAHPDVVIDIAYPTKPDDDPAGTPTTDGTAKTTAVEFPAGFGINLADTPTCSFTQLTRGECPDGSFIGNAAVTPTSFGFSIDSGIYNMERPPGVPAQAGFSSLGAITLLRGSVRSGGDYGITVGASDISTAVSIQSLRLTLLGVPGDPARNGGETPAGPLPAVTANPTRCTGAPMAFAARATSYEEPDVVRTRVSTTQPDGTPLTLTDCATLPFEPTVDVKPTTTAPDSPTGLDLDLLVPQDSTNQARQTAHLKDLALTLPEGMNVNPAAADGLQACSPAQIALDSGSAPTCPDASSLGSVSIDSPLLTEPLVGKAYLAQQGANPFGTTFGLYLVASAQGVTLKLPGRVDPDPQTGRLRVTFPNQPELPFSRLSVRLDGGNRAILTTPATCGPQTVTGEATPWSGGPVKPVSSGFDVDCAAGLGGFAPTFAAGTTPAVAGAFAPLSIGFGRPDGQQALTGVAVTLPPGLIARPAAVTPCTEAQASADACPAASKVGSARVLAGAGAAPFPLGGEAFLTGPYKGAPYGLLVRFRAVAGPLDLGTVVVRQALSIDAEDAHVTAVSDPLPTIVGGVPIRLRDLSLVFDKPGFTVNPTSCAPTQIGATLTGAGGATANLAARFAASRCQDLLLQPQLRLSLTGRKSLLKRGGHPGISARLTQPAGQSNLRRVEVKLPLSLALDPENAETLCEPAAAAAKEPSCPEGAAIGTATVRTSLLPEPLTGPVYLARGVRTTSTGREVRTLPTLVLPLRGNGVQINVRANTTVRGGRLVTQFDRIPDAAITSFDFRLDGGRRGILAATRNVCRTSRNATLRFRGHSGRLVKASRRLRAACGRG